MAKLANPWLLTIFALTGLIASNSALAGPISKWDDREPKVKYETDSGIFDVERCIEDLDGVPMPQQVWHADRPNELKLIWKHPSLPVVNGRLDAKHANGVTTVTAWNLADNAIDKLKVCAPPRIL